MQQILLAMEALDPQNLETAAKLDSYLQDALDLCHKLLARGYSEEKTSHMVNYCKMKLEFAQKQIANDELEEGLQFAKTVLTFYLREARTESASLHDQDE